VTAGSLGTYSFLPWLRRGLANHITTPDLDPGLVERPQLDVSVRVQANRLAGGVETVDITRSVSLQGPGDILGIYRAAIVRVEPRHLTTNVEPNYLAHIEFYDEDLPWRYTPAAPDLATGRLRPWITLLVLTEDEFTDGRDLTGRPLPYVDVADLTALPRADELWAWAHVQVNGDLAANPAEFVSHDMPAVMARLSAALDQNRDLAYSRLICPRKLAANTAYHALLVPTFETGRRAGLGHPSAGVPATLSAWDAGERPDPTSFPVYHRWYFRTGDNGDFESLVRLLSPRPVDRRVGTRPMDVQHPGSGVSGVDNPALGGLLRLGAALRAPAPSSAPPDVFENWDIPFPRPLQVDLAHLLNLSDDYRRAGAPDPVVTPPLYGQWHALARRVLTRADGTPDPRSGNWLHRLNLDPRFRVAAGLGTRVVAERQEAFMAAAWEQVGEILEAQRRVRQGQLAIGVSTAWYDRCLLPTVDIGAQRVLSLLAPLNKRLRAGELTVHHTLLTARVPPALTSGAFRRRVRPRGRLVRGLRFDVDSGVGDLFRRVNGGEVLVAPPRVAPPGVLTYDEAADRLGQAHRQGADELRERNLGPDWVDGLPGAAGFVIGLPGQTEPPHKGPDSPEAKKFKRSLRDEFGLFQASLDGGATPPRSPVDLPALAADGLAALRPADVIGARIRAGLHVPGRIVDEIGDRLVEPMAYPVIDLPMYQPLRDISSELFLPGADRIPHNSITLLETNQRFIEAYLVGLNHEFARELLWRGYPTDQRGTPFRQFWDVSGFLDPDGSDVEASRERMRDIPPLHQWSTTSALGTHDHRQSQRQEDGVLLVIRGELLKRYPNAVLYAHRAQWQTADGEIDPTKERRLVTLAPDEEANPPLTAVRTPLYHAKIEPDLYLLGFDISVASARGGTGVNPGDDPGWFFVLKERPGEPRFGLDVGPVGARHVWNDLSWDDLRPGPPGGYLEVSAAPAALPLVEPGESDQEKTDQHAEDVNVVWSHDVSAAEMAYILFQVPVIVAVHAAEMLPR
jgi:hypothetical protein